MIVIQDGINARLVLRFPLRRLLLVVLTLPAGQALSVATAKGTTQTDGNPLLPAEMELGVPTGRSAVRYVNVACVGRLSELGLDCPVSRHLRMHRKADSAAGQRFASRIGGRRRFPFPC